MHEVEENEQDDFWFWVMFGINMVALAVAIVALAIAYFGGSEFSWDLYSTDPMDYYPDPPALRVPKKPKRRSLSPDVIDTMPKPSESISASKALSDDFSSGSESDLSQDE